MNRIVVALSMIACASFTQPAVARDDVYSLKIQDVLDSPEFEARVGKSFFFAFADRQGPADAPIEEYVAEAREHYRNRPEEPTCRDTFILGFSQLKMRAQRKGGDAVIGIVGYFKRKAFSSTTQFQCHAGEPGVYVTLRGKIVKLQK